MRTVFTPTPLHFTKLIFCWLLGSSSPYINRFLQPDTIIPGAANPQSWNRYSYVTNNPIRFADPSGHKPCSDVDEHGDCIPEDPAAFIKYVARRKGIHLSPKDHWEFLDFLSHEEDGENVWGHTPRSPDSYPYDEKYYYDRNGKIHLIDDSAVYI
ncbi:MAG: RHS repeat-associated core domain-containing protein, partial [Anaerolineales bacterium]